MCYHCYSSEHVIEMEALIPLDCITGSTRRVSRFLQNTQEGPDQKHKEKQPYIAEGLFLFIL